MNMNSRSASILVAWLLILSDCVAAAADPAPVYDFECVIAGDEIEVKALNTASSAWMKNEGFFPWIWVDGHRVEITGLFSPGYRNDVGWLTYAESHGWRATPYCWSIARRYTPQN